MNRLIKSALIVLAAAAMANAQSGSDVESGTNFQAQIRYQNNQAAQFIRVELWTDGETTWRTFATTDRMGKFHTGAPCMVIQYKAEPRGFRPIYGRVDMSLKPCRALEAITLIALPGTEIPGSEPAPSGTIDARIAAIPADAQGEFSAGQRAVNKNEFASSIPHLQKAIALYSRFAEAYQLLALAQIKTQQGPAAEASLRKAIAIEDRLPQAHHLLGVLLAMTGRTEMAEKTFIHFAELEPANPDAPFELAKVAFALNKFAEAEQHARKAIELKEKDDGVEALLAYTLLRQGKAEEAKEAFRSFLRLAPGSAMKADVEKTIAMIDEHERQPK